MKSSAKTTTTAVTKTKTTMTTTVTRTPNRSTTDGVKWPAEHQVDIFSESSRLRLDWWMGQTRKKKREKTTNQKESPIWVTHPVWPNGSLSFICDARFTGRNPRSNIRIVVWVFFICRPRKLLIRPIVPPSQIRRTDEIEIIKSAHWPSRENGF